MKTKSSSGRRNKRQHNKHQQNKLQQGLPAPRLLKWTQPPISIIGAGIGGLTLAQCLRARGVPVTIYERLKLRPSPWPERSYAITLHQWSYQPLLKILGIDETNFKRRIAVDCQMLGKDTHNPRVLADQSTSKQSSFRANRDFLEQLLRNFGEGLDIQWGHTLDMAQTENDHVALCFVQRPKAEAKCAIAVDGPHSHTRRSLLPTTKFNVLPIVAFHGTRTEHRRVFNELYQPGWIGTNVIELKQKNVLLTISIDEETQSLIKLSWVYSRPSFGLKDPLHKPNRPSSISKDIPEAFYHEIGALQDLEGAFKEIFDEEKLRKMPPLHWMMRALLVSLPELQELGKKGVFFIGDSVHVESIIGGHGANMAIKDAVDLAEVIAAEGPEGILKWYEKQHPIWRRGVEGSEKMVAIMHAEVGNTSPEYLGENSRKHSREEESGTAEAEQGDSKRLRRSLRRK